MKRPRYSAKAGGDPYTEEEREFMMGMEALKRRLGVRWLTWSEILAEVKRLGYRRPPKRKH